jgi:hypothetical protein
MVRTTSAQARFAGLAVSLLASCGGQSKAPPESASLTSASTSSRDAGADHPIMPDGMQMPGQPPMRDHTDMPGHSHDE